MTKQEAIEFFSALFGGVHHIIAPIEEAGYGWKTRCLQPLATYDGNLLTRSVLLAHHHCIRLEIQPLHHPNEGFGYGFNLMIHKRQREGSIFERHPDIHAAIKAFELSNAKPIAL